MAALSGLLAMVRDCQRAWPETRGVREVLYLILFEFALIADENKIVKDTLLTCLVISSHFEAGTSTKLLLVRI